jgi:hypothetical protein
MQLAVATPHPKPPTASVFFFFISRQTRKQYNDHKQLKQSIEKHQNENFLQKRPTSSPPSLRQPRRHTRLVIYLVSGLRRLANAPEQISTSGSPQWAHLRIETLPRADIPKVVDAFSTMWPRNLATNAY